VRLIVGLLCLALLAVLLAEFFVVFLLPRRVKRDPRVARGLLRSMWRPWRALARRLPTAAADTMLWVFGPLGLPDWIPGEVRENWRVVLHHPAAGRRRELP
jgi:hypothetical protein